MRMEEEAPPSLNLFKKCGVHSLKKSCEKAGLHFELYLCNRKGGYEERGGSLSLKSGKKSRRLPSRGGGIFMSLR